MKVPAGRVTKGMSTEQYGMITSIKHREGSRPVLLEGEKGRGEHADTDDVEVLAHVYRVQYYDFAWGGFRDIETPIPGNCFVGSMSEADALIRQVMANDSNTRRRYRILKSDGSTVVYRNVNNRITIGS